MAEKFDFGGYATRNDIKCADGRTIRRNAFIDNDGMTVPLVWNHGHNDSDNVLGHVLLENRSDGVYCYGVFNKTERGQNAKEMVRNGDITGLSIYANHLKQDGGNVLHGAIREVSLVLAGANKGAYIDTILAHSEEGDEAALIAYVGELQHSIEGAEEITAEPKAVDGNKLQNKPKEENKMADKTVQDVIDSMNEEQKNVLYALVGMAAEGKGGAGGEAAVKHNLFEDDYYEEDDNVLTHADMEEIIGDAKRYGSLKESFLQHGIDNIEYLFPDNKNINGNGAPGFINTIPNAWVDIVMKGVGHTPFARVKMEFADIREDEARAKGYIKGNFKREEVFSLLKRTINPTNVYKKQKLDREDVVDITDFDVISWIKGEMRMKLDEELARAYLFGDKRLSSDDDKINEACIIPVCKDTTNNFYAMEKTVTQASGETLEHAMIDTVVRAMDEYEGSGHITLFLKTANVTSMLLMEDTIGHKLYKNIDELANAMGVDRIVKVPASIVTDGCYGVALDLRDYNVGADKNGAVNMFDDFDIDYNAQKYLIETRCSGGLTKPHSAIVLKVANA